MKVTLKAARINCGLTLKQAAKAIGCSISALSYWENSKVDITAVNLARLCALYGVDISNIQIDYEKNLISDSPMEKGAVK